MPKQRKSRRIQMRPKRQRKSAELLANTESRPTRAQIMQYHPGIWPRPPNSNQIFRLTQYAADGVIAQTATNPSFGAYNFILNNLDQASSLESVFDQYMIVKVEALFTPMYTATSMTSSSATVLSPNIYVVADYDDSTALTTIGAARDYQNSIEHDDKTPFHVSINPAVAIAAYSGSFSSYANRQFQWIDCASPNVQHYGLKYAITAGAVGQTALQQWNVSFRYTLAFRNVR